MESLSNETTKDLPSINIIVRGEYCLAEVDGQLFCALPLMLPDRVKFRQALEDVRNVASHAVLFISKEEREKVMLYMSRVIDMYTRNLDNTFLTIGKIAKAPSYLLGMLSDFTRKLAGLIDDNLEESVKRVCLAIRDESGFVNNTRKE